jgi:mono/diheme cytochrome c family protein
MRKVLSTIGMIFGVLLAIILIGLMALYSVTQEKLNKIYDVQVGEISIPSDPASIESGKKIVNTRGLCFDCHGENFAGQVFDEGPLVGRITVKNLTPGEGGIGKTFKDTDWVRAIRHGLGPDGKPLVDMPSNFYYKFSDHDLAEIIAYLKSLPAVDSELPPKQIGLMARWFILQDPSLIAAQVIDHNAPRPTEPAPGITIEYGQYLAEVCTLCHGEDYAGGPEPGAGVNLTAGGNLAEWSEADFIQTIRSGVNPNGKQLNPELMPWKRIREMSDDELKAIWLFLRSLPPIETPTG